jgi:hypothetical protein
MRERGRETYTTAWLADLRTSLPQSAGAERLVMGSRWKGCGSKERANWRKLDMMEKGCCFCCWFLRVWRMGRAAVRAVRAANIFVWFCGGWVLVVVLR